MEQEQPPKLTRAERRRQSKKATPAQFNLGDVFQVQGVSFRIDRLVNGGILARPVHGKLSMGTLQEQAPSAEPSRGLRKSWERKGAE